MQPVDTNVYFLLNQVGLTLNESQVYVYLLQYGSRLGAEIYGDLRMDKSSCYRALKSLTDKNLVYSIGEERNQQFSANPPEHLESLVRQEEKRLDTIKQAFSQFETTFVEQIRKSKGKKNVTVITTEAGRRQYMESRLRCKNKLIRDLSGRHSSEIYYPDYDKYIADFISRRVKAGIYLRQLAPFGDTDGKWERSSKELLKEVRVLPKDFKAQATFCVWDDMVALSSKDKGEQIGIMLRDELIAELMTSLFDYIWISVEG